MVFFIAAITLGFLGSFHCIGMCGPIALALPVHREKPLRKFLLVLYYNFGRILTYSVFGLVAGSIGQVISIAGYQQVLSISIGTILLLGVLSPLFLRNTAKFQTGIFSAMNKVKKGLSKLFRQKGAQSLFLVGLLNGLLPCGLVYMGIAGSLATGGFVKGALFMAVFGLGTLPAMLVIGVAGSAFSLSSRNNIRRLVPFFISLTALILILRGLNLDIPYVSPKIDDGKTISCHNQQTPSAKNTILCSGHDLPPKK